MYACTWDNYTFVPLQEWLILVARLPSAIFEDGGYAAPPPQQCKAFPPGTLTREHRSAPGSDYSTGFNPPDNLSRIGSASWPSQQGAKSSATFSLQDSGRKTHPENGSSPVPVKQGPLGSSRHPRGLAGVAGVVPVDRVNPQVHELQERAGT